MEFGFAVDVVSQPIVDFPLGAILFHPGARCRVRRLGVCFWQAFSAPLVRLVFTCCVH